MRYLGILKGIRFSFTKWSWLPVAEIAGGDWCEQEQMQEHVLVNTTTQTSYCRSSGHVVVVDMQSQVIRQIQEATVSTW